MIKIIVTRCYILRLKCTIFDFCWGSARWGSSKCSHRPLAKFKEFYFLREGERKGKKEKKRRGKWNENGKRGGTRGISPPIG